MFQPKKQQPTQISNIRLPKLAKNPGFEDLQYALGQAQKNRGKTIELPWSETSGSYKLTLKVDQGGGEPLWTMLTGDSEDARVNWEYASGDMQLILNLALAESAGGQLQDVMQHGAYAAAPKDPSQTGSSGSTASTPAQTAKAAHQLDPSLTESGTRAKAILEGELTNMQVPNLLQSVTMSKMTGRLGVQSDGGNADIYFEEGVPVHAQIGTTEGDSAVIELLMWEEGQFRFYQGELTTHRTTKRRLESVLMEGVALVDQNKYLKDQGVTPQTYLLRKNKNLSEAQFEQTVAAGAPLDLNVQKRFYQAIDNKSTLFEILRNLPLAKTEWIPVMFNMISCDLIALTNKPPLVTVEQALPLEALGVDRSAIETVVKALQRPESGMFTFPAFLYLLQQEFHRFEAFSWPLSLVVFEMRFRPAGPQGPLEPLPSAAVKEIAGRINTVKRNTDFLAHYETFDYACLLSNTNTAAAAMFANRVVEVIRSAPVPGTPDVRSISISLGIACLPEDCPELGLLLAAAREAKNRAKENNMPVALYRDIRKR